MKNWIITNAINLLLELLSPEIIKKALDSFLNTIEDYVEKTPNKFDDAAIGTLCSLVRKAIGIPDSKP